MNYGYLAINTPKRNFEQRVTTFLFYEFIFIIKL